MYYFLKDKQRFCSKLTIGEIDQCWNWNGGIGGNGYGHFWLNGKTEPTHRVAFKMFHKKDIPVDLFVCHTCDNPICCNPKHLYLGTHQDNVDDKLRRNRQHSGTEINTNKLSPKQVLLIRSRGITENTHELGVEFGVSQSTICRIIRKEIWKRL